MEIKEEIPEKIALVSQVEKKSNWIIDSGCSHYMIGDMKKKFNFKSHYGGIIKVGNNTTC